MHTPIVVVLEDKGWRAEQLFSYVNIAAFLLLPLEYGKCDSSRTPMYNPQSYFRHHWKPYRATNKKQETSEKKILVALGARRINWESAQMMFKSDKW
jgi:hypothetical protein